MKKEEDTEIYFEADHIKVKLKNFDVDSKYFEDLVRNSDSRRFIRKSNKDLDS